jgi:transcription antitermination factor NusG
MTWLLVRVMRLAHEPRRRLKDFHRHKGYDRGAFGGHNPNMTDWLANLAMLGFETYYPIIRELRRVTRDQLSHHQRVSNVMLMRPREVPFLPQSVFVHDDGNAGHIAAHPGVIGFFCVGDEPARISDRLVDNLKRREVDGVIPGATPAEFIFKVGDEIEVIDGPLAMRRGKVDVAPDCPLENIDAETKLRLTIDNFAVVTTVANVRKV